MPEDDPPEALPPAFEPTPEPVPPPPGPLTADQAWPFLRNIVR